MSSSPRRPGRSASDLDLELGPPTDGVEPRTDPDGASQGVDAETELDLRLPDMTIPPVGPRDKPRTALVGGPTRPIVALDGAPPEEAPLELARPVGRARGGGGARELDAPASEGSLELAREPRSGRSIPRARAAPPPRAPRRGDRALVVVLIVVALAAAAIVAMLAGYTPARVRSLLESRLPPEAKAAVAALADDSLVAIPAGNFARGCTADDSECGADERPPELMTMPALAIGRTEVTASDYAACVASGACTAAGTQDPLCSAGHPERAREPANCVDAAQAATYCAARGQRLPTAAEWEFAARGGQSVIYPWGAARASCTQANLGGCGGKPDAVGARPAGASGHGLLDMAGNVWEWTADGKPERREIRGGSYLDAPRTLRASNRGWADARTRIPELGFRCAR